MLAREGEALKVLANVMQLYVRNDENDQSDVVLKLHVGRSSRNRDDRLHLMVNLNMRVSLIIKSSR